MPYLSTLVKRATMGRTLAVVLVLAACARSDGASVLPAAPGGSGSTSPVIAPVSDLRVSDASDTSASVVFTEVGDSNGVPATYDVRLADAPISWSSAPNVTRGSCASPIIGAGVGDARTCVVYGLADSTTYDIQLGVFAENSNTSSTPSAFSNVARFTTKKHQATVASVTLSPATASVLAGVNTQYAVVLKDVHGNTLSGLQVQWSTSNSAVAIASGSGLVSAIAAGTVTVSASSGGVIGTATLTVTAPAGTLTHMTMTPATASLLTGGTQQFAVSGVWSNGATTTPAATYSATGGTITSAGLYTAGSSAGTFRVIAVQQGGTLADTSAITITAAVASTTLLSEGFEDGNLASRGWFDATTVAVAADARPGSSGTHSLQWHWTAGLVAPEGSSRIDFTPSNSVYLSYWVKTSANWVGSGEAFHPHMFSFLTTADDHYIGPSITHLTLYDELLYLNGNLMANLAMQDALMINAANLNVDLLGITELRSIGGLNGKHEFSDAASTVSWDAYLASPGQYTNYKSIRPTAVAISNATKNSWHHIESYWQLNTVVGGIGQQDGVLQYWVDGVQQVNRRDVFFRTGANSTMKFRTFLMGPWIGDGSPVDQYMWIDDLLVATAHP